MSDGARVPSPAQQKVLEWYSAIYPAWTCWNNTPFRGDLVRRCDEYGWLINGVVSTSRSEDAVTIDVVKRLSPAGRRILEK